MQKKAIGEIVVDATASPYDENKILIAHYPYFIMARKMENMNKTDIADEETGETFFNKVHSWEEFDGYTHNLLQPKK